ncbi:tyrosine-protein phosphatase 10D-like isoform X2 [Palaemon carinicauda]
MHLGGSSCGTGMKRQFWRCGIGLTRLESTPITKEFNRYQLFLSGKKKVPPLIVDGGDAPREATFDGLDPGKTYNVSIKTVSGEIASWPTTGNVTLRPLPVMDFLATESEVTREVTRTWKDDEISIPDRYKIFYQEVETFNGDSRTKVVQDKIDVNELSPKPASPIIEELQPIPAGFIISWKSDVTSRQEKYTLVYTRNDTGVKSI